ncbi:MAG: nitroreductase family protein [Anaerolineae bacterium]
MDVLEAIKKRRSIRDFTDQPIEREHLAQILDAARWAPTVSNQQKWKFVVVTDPTVKELIKKVSPGIFAMPAVFVVICMEKDPEASAWDEWTYAADAVVAAQNMMLAAFELGIGSCPALSFAKEGVQEILDIPEGIEPELIVTLGHFKKLPKAPARRPLNEIVFGDRYGEEWTS